VSRVFTMQLVDTASSDAFKTRLQQIMVGHPDLKLVLEQVDQAYWTEVDIQLENDRDRHTKVVLTLTGYRR
jgi:hypothetical protein